MQRILRKSAAELPNSTNGYIDLPTRPISNPTPTDSGPLDIAEIRLKQLERTQEIQAPDPWDVVPADGKSINPKPIISDRPETHPTLAQVKRAKEEGKFASQIMEEDKKHLLAKQYANKSDMYNRIRKWYNGWGKGILAGGGALGGGFLGYKGAGWLYDLLASNTKPENRRRRRILQILGGLGGAAGLGYAGYRWADNTAKYAGRLASTNAFKSIQSTVQGVAGNK